MRVGFDEASKQNQALLQKTEHMVDCKTELIKAQEEVRQLKQKSAEQERQISELQEAHQADQQYIVFAVETSNG